MICSIVFHTLKYLVMVNWCDQTADSVHNYRKHCKGEQVDPFTNVLLDLGTRIPLDVAIYLLDATWTTNEVLCVLLTHNLTLLLWPEAVDSM